MKYTITVRATSITVSPGSESMELLQPLLNLLEYEDEMTEEVVALGYILDNDTNILYLHKGVDLKYLQKLLINVEFVNEPYDEFNEMNFEYEEIVPPRNEEQIDVINFISGQKDFSSNLNDRQLFLVKTPGFGKFEPYSRKIPAPYSNTGYIKMGDLKLGDYVFGRDGKPTKVIGIFEQGEQDVFKITFKDGRTAYCGEEHLWTVKYGSCPNWKTVMLKDMINNFKVISSWKQNNGRSDIYDYKYHIPVNKAVNYQHQNVSIDPWVLGCFIGNGCCTSYQLTISASSAEIPNKIADICNFIVKKKDVSDKYYSYIFYYQSGKPVRTKDFFSDIPDMIGCYSYDKIIPNEYMINDVNTRISLLQGLMDTDGSMSNDDRFHVNYTSTSRKLLEQIVWLLYSLGYSGAISNDNRTYEKYTHGYCGAVIFRIPNSVKYCLFTTIGKRSVAMKAIDKQQDDYYSTLLIKNIEYSHREECRCIMVDNSEHLYLTEDFIVTHNTYCSSVGLCKFNSKTLIIMHREALRLQWLKSLYKMTGFSSKDVHEITSSEELCDIAYGRLELDYDVYLMTHATFRAGLKRMNNFSDMRNVTKNLGIGMKIIDEAHLEFRNTLLIDFLFNVCRNLYLTATDGRSDKDENAIFKMVFSNAEYYKKPNIRMNNQPSKWVNYIRIEINSNCPNNVYRYRVNGGRGMSAISYGKWVIANDKKQTHFKVCRDILRDIYERDQDAKVLIFMPLIDLCDEVAHFCRMSLNYDESFGLDLNIKTINSHNSKMENDRNKRADVIATTIGSCGTGTDIPGITDIISCSPFASKITAEQVFGRLRYCGKTCHYYDITDASVPMDKLWLRARQKKLCELALNSNQKLVWFDDSIDNSDKPT